MDIQGILEAEDRLFTENRAAEVEDLLLGAVAVAADEMDEVSLLQLLNELLGYYRETSEWEKAFAIADQALMVAGRICPEESVPFATTLLNIATVYRGGGRLKDSLACYDRVEEIYAKILPPDAPLVASLCNNKSLLYQEMGDFARSRDALLRAIAIVTGQGNTYEEAVSRANLAGTLIQLGELEDAFAQARISVALFEEQGVEDQHLCAALSAMGSYCYLTGDFYSAMNIYQRAMEIMEKSLGRNDYYARLKENYEACKAAQKQEDAAEAAQKQEDVAETAEEASKEASKKEVGPGERGKEVTERSGRESKAQPETPVLGIDLCRKYYETYGAPMLHKRFAAFEHKIAVGLAGEGSDAFGLDDAVSRDHDWGPSFCLWVTQETYDAIGKQLEAAYEALPEEIDGFHRAPLAQGAGRRGVCVISDFYKRLLQTDDYEAIDWSSVSDASLAAAVNGEVWRDDEGIFSAMRNRLKEGYPAYVLYGKLAESCGRFGQTGQYNFLRVLLRGDSLTATTILGDALREAEKLLYYAQGQYPLHDKWLRKGLLVLEGGAQLDELLLQAQIAGFRAILSDGLTQELVTQVSESMDAIGGFLAMELYRRDFLSDIDPGLTDQVEELLGKSIDSRKTTEDLAMEIAQLEFKAFDKVQNEGGRADCQDDWPTFSIMRRSQYLTWNRTMLLQYLYDFRREMRLGHNLITEKYARMMASTAPERYEELKDHFPQLTPEKEAIIAQIVGIQVKWMEEFSAEFPHLGQQARSIHTSQDTSFNTSYETYLRGELGTYSDKMLELYARFIVDLTAEGKNLARMTMEGNTRLYGYESLEAAERFLAL